MTTVQDILGEGFTKPIEFRAALISQAEMHDNYLRLARDPLAKRGAENQKSACLTLYDIAGDDTLTTDQRIEKAMSTIATLVVGVNAAAKLAGIPAHVRTAAVVRWEEERQS